MANLFDAFCAAVRRRGSSDALVIMGEASGPTSSSVTFSELLSRVDSYTTSLAALGVGRASPVAFSVAPRHDFAPMIFALFRLGAVPIFIDGTMDANGLATCFRECRPAFLIADAPALRRCLEHGNGLPSVRALLEITERGSTIEHSVVRREAPLDPEPAFEEEDPACMFYTTGSTGTPKGVVWTHTLLSSNIAIQEALYGRGDEHIDLVTFPFFMITALAQGRTCVLPRIDHASPARFPASELVRAIQAAKASYCFASPAAWRRVTEHCLASGVRLDPLRHITTAGAAVSARLVEELSRVAPQAKVHTPYGATEAIVPVVSIESALLLDEAIAERTRRGEGVCIGRPVAGVTVGVIPFSDEPIADMSRTRLLAAGETGELVVTGPTVSDRYYRRTAATEMAKIAETRPDGGRRIWHRLGDAGHIDAEGLIWYGGRVKFGFTLAGRRYFPDQVEAVFNAEPGILRTAAVSVTWRGREVMALAVEREHTGTRTEDELRAAIVGRARHARLPLTLVYFHDGAFPVDPRHNVKIERDTLRERLAAALATGLPVPGLFEEDLAEAHLAEAQ